jgi:hypothetical protein
MTHPEGPTQGFFGEFQDDFKNADKAEVFGTGRIPEGPYKAVCTLVDTKGDGDLIDHEKFQANSGTKGLKIYLEILEPESVKPKGKGDSIPTKGEILEHVFWVTKNNLPYIKRDISTIFGRDIDDLSEVETAKWAGNTCEIGVADETYQGFVKSRVKWFNKWAPKKPVTPTPKVTAKEGDKAPAATQAPGENTAF